jgi:D-3-phosphoglycerate dehydrogenase
MNISILDDYLDTLPTLDCFRKLDGHTVTVWNDHTQDVDLLAERLHDADALVRIITADDLARTEPSALFVNTSRAPLVAPGVLVAALRAGRPGLAAVDVYETEPGSRAHDSTVHRVVSVRERRGAGAAG